MSTVKLDELVLTSSARVVVDVELEVEEVGIGPVVVGGVSCVSKETA